MTAPAVEENTPPIKEVWLVENPEMDEDDDHRIIWTTDPDVYPDRVIYGPYILQTKPESAEKPEENTADAEAAFRKRWEEDGAETMSEEEWGAWVDALPKEEFIAMIVIGSQKEG